MNWKSCKGAATAATGLLAMAGMANSASAQCTTYSVTTGSGASIVPGTTDIGNHVDDGGTTVTLPFAWNFYGTNYSSFFVTSNGYILGNPADPSGLWDQGHGGHWHPHH